MTDSTNSLRPTADQLAPVLSDLADLLDRAPAASAAQPTPCSEYSVADLNQHVIGWLTAFADGYADPEGRCSDPADVTVAGTGADQVRAAAQRLVAAAGAATPDQPLSIGGQAMPSSLALPMILWEYQVHGWDLATALGEPWSPAEDGLRASLDFAPGMLTPDYQGEGKTFGPRVPVGADAPLIEQLVGLSGRDPRWTAGSA